MIVENYQTLKEQYKQQDMTQMHVKGSVVLDILLLHIYVPIDVKEKKFSCEATFIFFTMAN